MADPNASFDSRRYCEHELRRHDHDRYLASLMVAGNARRAVTALYAFNLEIARTREVVTEAVLGEMRLQFWRDVVDEIYRGNQARQHPVAQELAHAISEFGFMRDPIDRLLSERQHDLGNDPPSSFDELEKYVAGTSIGLLELASATAGAVDNTTANVVCDIGMSNGLIGLVRALPFHARQRRLYLPADLLDEAGVDRETIFAGHFSPALGTVITQVAERVSARLVSARQSWRALSKPQRAVLLIGSLAALDLKRLATAGYNPFDPHVQILPLRRLLQLIGARVTGRL